MTRFFGLLSLMLALLALAPAARADDIENDYTPTPRALAAISVDQARAIVAQEIRGWGLMASGDIADIKVELSRLQIITKNGGTYTVTLADAPIAVTFGNFFHMAHAVTIGRYSFGVSYNEDEAQIEHAVDALYVLKNAASQGLGDEAGFAEIAASYRAANPKPVLPEEARRFEVQAEGAVRDNDFAGAALLYERALAAAPWWPGGHFNRAVLLSEIGEYPLAMAEMKRYLALAPGAPDARAAQNDIYDWERRAAQAEAASRAAPQPVILQGGK